MKILLLPFSWFYALVMICRNKAFDVGLFRSVDVGVPVISVGNLTAGGTGKTPLVEFITQVLLGKGKRLAIVSRGYGRASRGVRIVSDGRSLLLDAVQGGDEPVQIARKFPQAIVVVGERRVDAAKIAVDQFGANVIVIDDGFQHRYLRRDRDIVVVDSQADLVREPVLPAGMRREPMAGLRRAGFLVFSKVASKDVVDARRTEISPWFDGPTMSSRYRIESVRRADDGTPVNLDGLLATPAVAFSGIGDHDGFVSGLRGLGFTVSADLRFPDHHRYSDGDFRHIRSEMERTKSGICMTTEKDATRILSGEHRGKSFLETHQVYYSRIVLDILDGKERMLSFLDIRPDRQDA
jgi:tetraacyldisaccharide 4'-kinase